MKRVRVLAIDQQVDKQEGEALIAKTATLEVSPKEAERIAVSLQMGQLSMSLNSLSNADSEKALSERLIGGEKPFDPKMVRNEGRSYTLDNDIYHMWGDSRLFPTSKDTREVNVVRGSDAVVQGF